MVVYTNMVGKELSNHSTKTVLSQTYSEFTEKTRTIKTEELIWIWVINWQIIITLNLIFRLDIFEKAFWNAVINVSITAQRHLSYFLFVKWSAIQYMNALLLYYPTTNVVNQFQNKSCLANWEISIRVVHLISYIPVPLRLLLHINKYLNSFWKPTDIMEETTKKRPISRLKWKSSNLQETEIGWATPNTVQTNIRKVLETSK